MLNFITVEMTVKDNDGTNHPRIINSHSLAVKKTKISLMKNFNLHEVFIFLLDLSLLHFFKTGIAMTLTRTYSNCSTITHSGKSNEGASYTH